MKQLAFLLTIIFIYGFSFAQNDTKFDIDGIIVKVDTDSALAYVHIINKEHSNGAISDELGRFSIQASIGDTLLFSSIGYQDFTYIVDSIYIIKVELAVDVTMLPEQVILPIPKNVLLLRQAMSQLEIRDSTDILKENMEKAGFKAPPVHPVKPKVTPLNPIHFFYEKVVEKIKEKKIKKDKVGDMPKLE